MSALLSILVLASAVGLEPVPFTDVEISDRFWTPRQRTNRTATVDHSLQMLEKAGNFSNLELASQSKREGFKGLLFTDSDIYKVIEGIAFTLAKHPNPALERRLDAVIDKIGAAQQPDGYLNTWFQVTRPDQKWTNLRDHHELYCAGHLIEAAVAHRRATGKRTLYDIAVKFAEHINRRFGKGGVEGYPGHPELELALAKLAEVSGDSKWMDLARLMVERRGGHYFAREHRIPESRYDGTYHLDDVPIVEHREIKGHAVRAAYLLAGVADVVRDQPNDALERMLRRVWRNATQRRIFVTGGIGPSAHNEGFTVDYDLPNRTAYQETCASIAMAIWGNRMGLLFADASYHDAVETALYNGMLSGVSLDGRRFFYVNPLASDGGHHRREWFECACCPPNVLRTIASIGGYAYARDSQSLYVNLYIGGQVKTKVGSETAHLNVRTDYPWDGRIEMTVREGGRFALKLRNPGWSEGATIKRNGTPVEAARMNGYFVLPGPWRPGDRVELDLPMPAQQIVAHPHVKDDLGFAAVRRGPLVYCLEQVDQTVPVQSLVLPPQTRLTPRFDAGALGGVVVLDADAWQVSDQDWQGKLYQPLQEPRRAKARLVPYGFWDNRGAGAMAVWTPTSPPPAKVVGPEGQAQVLLSFRSGNAQPWGINDGVEPKSSSEQPAALCHFWPHKGGEEWVQYSWPAAKRISGVKLYWFDDTGRGECRVPASWRLQSWTGGQWKDVPLAEASVAKDKWIEVAFPPVETTRLRLVIRQQEGWASGVHEWKVVLDEDE